MIITSMLIASLWMIMVADPCPASTLWDKNKSPGTVMIVIEDVGNANEFVGYAENLIKKRFKEKGTEVIDPQTMKKVKENKMLWHAIQNASATAMAKIMTDYGAHLLIRGGLSVEARQKFAVSWEGTAALSLNAIDTVTAKEVATVTSDPLGTAENPAPIEDSPLIAKQIAVQRVCDNVLVQLGVLSGTGMLKGATTIGFDLFDIFSTPSGKAKQICFSSDGRHLLLGGGKTVTVRDLFDKQTDKPFKISRGDVTAVAISPDGRTVAAGNNRGQVHVWSMETRKLLFTMKGHRKRINDLAFSPDNHRLASAGADEQIRVTDIRFGKNVGLLKGHTDAVHSIAFTTNSRNLISAAEDLTIHWWDVNIYKEKKTIRESADRLLSMAISHDGTVAAMSTVDVRIDLVRNTRTDVRHIMVRNTATGEEIRELSGHKKDVTSLSFHPNKRFLASGSIDNTIKIWDLQKGDIVTQFEQDDDIQCVSFSDDGQWFAALAKNQQVNVWKLR